MCDAWPEVVLLEYLEGRLPGAEVTRLRAHLPTCADCREGLAALEGLRRVARDSSPAPYPAADRRVEALIRQTVARRRWKRRAAAFVGLAAAVTLASGLAALLVNPGARAAVRVAEVHAHVVVQRGAVECPAEVGMALEPTDTLLVPADGALVLAFADASRAELGPETTLSLADPTWRDDGGSAPLYLREGFLAVEAQTRGATAELRIRTPDAEAAVRGTKFTVGTGDDRTAVRVAEGRVRLTRVSDGRAVDVPAGYGSLVAAGRDLQAVAARPGSVLQLVSADPRFPGWEHFNQVLAERFVGARLRRLGFRVEVRHYADVRPADLDGRAMVVVSLFDYNTGAEQALERIGLAASRVPVLCMEPAAYPALGMTGPQEKIDFGFRGAGAVRLAFPHPDHPLAAGLRGNEYELYPDVPGHACMGWGKPADSALTIASLQGQPDRACLFAYEAGAEMVGRSAPARRIGLFLDPWRTGAQSPAWALVEAAVEWAVQAP